MPLGVVVAGVMALIGAAFDIVPIAQELIATPSDQITTVRIVLGQTSDLEASFGGNTPGVALWDTFGQRIGYTPGTKKIQQQGSFFDIQVSADSAVGNVPAAYAAISNGGDDAICIASVTITFPDGGAVSFQPGDVGAACKDLPWMESSRIINVGKQPPKCLWIDRDGSGGLPFQGFGFHTFDFVNSVAQAKIYSNKTEMLCKSGPRFRMYDKIKVEDPILFFKPELKYTDDGTDAGPSIIVNNPGVLTQAGVFARDIPNMGAEANRFFTMPFQGHRRWGPQTGVSHIMRAGKRFRGKLVVSAMEGHSARRLCESRSSYGPDFVAVSENLFCDMDEKTLYDLCSETNLSCCFDLEKTNLRSCYVDQIRGKSEARRRSTDEVKTYEKVSYWGMEGDS